MRAFVLILLAQSMNLNNQPLLCMDEGAYCRVDRLRAFELNCSGAGATCTQTGGRMTISVTGSSGGGYDGGKVGEAYAADASISAAYLSLTCGAGEFVTCAGTSCSCSTPSGGPGGKVAEAYMADASITAQTATTAGAAFSTDASYLSMLSRASYSADASAVAYDTSCTGCIAIAELSATGSPSGTTYLRGDNTWSTPSGGSGPTIYASATGTATASNVTDPGITLHTKALTVAAADTITHEAWFRTLNNSGAVITPTLRCRIGSTTVVAVSDSTTVAASATNQAAYWARCRYSVVSSGSTLVMAQLERIPGTAAAASATSASRIAWATSASNFTGAQTFNLNWSSSTATATQTTTVHSYRLTQQASNP